jgi:hypothetical protein
MDSKDSLPWSQRPNSGTHHQPAESRLSLSQPIYLRSIFLLPYLRTGPQNSLFSSLYEDRTTSRAAGNMSSSGNFLFQESISKLFFYFKGTVTEG